MTSYENALDAVKDMNKITLGEEVNTPIGKGIAISLNMPSNGLYISPLKADVVVWFSTESSKDGWVQFEFSINDVSSCKDDE